MAQLTLFEGSHLPRSAAREALSRGDLVEAHVQLERLAGATEEAVDAARLERITSTLRAADENPVGTVHAAFVSALARVEPRGFLSDAEWFGLYAQRVARALAELLDGQVQSVRFLLQEGAGSGGTDGVDIEVLEHGSYIVIGAVQTNELGMLAADLENCPYLR